jgi:DNA/RNA-binding domain of Phe-tRNA-synthetase-like protein
MAMFMAELNTGLLTAAHDLECLNLPLIADIAVGGENYTCLNGGQQLLKESDLYIRDQAGILSSVIYGPDQRTRIRPETTQAAFTTYGVPGIHSDEIEEELGILAGYIKLFSPQMEQELLEVK